jgi:LmbE family N-acetylglucosaminyl deacetylase
MEALIKALCCVIPNKRTRRSVRRSLTRSYANRLVDQGHIHYLNDLLYPEFCSQDLLIGKKERCLVMAPHPDDEVIGCGGIMAKYPDNFDCMVINSSGVKYKHDTDSADAIAGGRMQEFYAVMAYLGIKNHWIFKIFGDPPHYDQIIAHTAEYLKAVDFKKYKYIFVPDRLDGHREHRFLTNYYLPLLMQEQGYNRHSYICYYGVWSTVSEPNYFEDISQVMDKKEQAILLYKSRTKNVDNYATRIKGLNYYYGLLTNTKYAEAYKVESIREYLAHEDDKAWAKYK